MDTMQQPRRWNLATEQPAAAELAARLKTSPLIAQILLSRGFSEPDDCQRFLRPSLNDLHKPALVPGLTHAAERVARAIRDHEKIVVYGDYDVDGITATTILWHAIRALGGEVDFYIPHRVEEGYGLNAEAVAQICDGGAKLILTVDCGITAIDPVKIAHDRGVDLIITDHHEWKEVIDVGRLGRGDVEATSTLPRTPTSPQSHLLLPDCYGLVHPRLPHSGAPYPNPSLCGAGVAFKLAWGIGMAVVGSDRVGDTFRSVLLDATALAALGTIADVVPLVGENRTLAYFGLGGLKQSRLVGIKALIASAGLTGQALSSFDVGFRLAPRLNACGRMGHARLAVEMLTTAGEARAAEIATYLEQQNRSRQTTERGIVDQAIEQVTERGLDKDSSCAIVLGDADWHPGVIGIVASRLVDRYHRPAIMVALSNGHGQGSGRSIAGFHLARALQACTEHLEAHGGHEMAAGLKLRTENFEAFREAFCAHAGQILLPEQLIPQLQLDSLAELNQITLAMINDLQRLGPFGHGNRRPIFCCRNVEIAGTPRRVGKTGDHLQLYVRQGGTAMKCIAFGYGNREGELRQGTKVDLAIEPLINEFNGCRNVELEIRDVQFTGVPRG